MKHKSSPNKKENRWRWSSIWNATWFERPFYSVAEQKSFDLELARLRSQTNVALTVGKVAYGLR